MKLERNALIRICKSPILRRTLIFRRSAPGFFARLTRLILYVGFGCLAFSTHPYAQDEDAPYELDLDDMEITWLPGERFDALSGKMNYTVTDLHIPGNGRLPIEIKRRFVQRSYFNRAAPSRDVFGTMDLVLPRVSVPYGSGHYYGCSNLNISSHTVTNNDNEHRINNLTGPITFSDEDRTIYFYDVNNSNRHLVVRENFENVDYISRENWIIKV